MKRILKNINLLNLLLIGAILIFINYTILPLFNMSVSYTLPKGKEPPVQKDKQIAEGTVPSLTDYVMVAEDNLFHPERKIPVDKTDKQSFEQPEFLLYGTLITDDVRLAYLEDRKSPLSTVGRGKRQTIVKLGDVMSGYTLKEIYPDKVVMARGDEMLTVLINDSTKSRAQVGTAGTQPQSVPKASSMTTLKAPASSSMPTFEQPTAPAPLSQTTPSTVPSTARGKSRRGPRNADSKGRGNSQRE